MKRWGVGTTLLLGMVLAAFGACDTHEGGDTQTNWLKACTADSECGTLRCICQRCTRPCESDGKCGGGPDRLTCATPASLGTRCAASVTTNVCVATCNGPSECELGQSCEGGLCAAEAAGRAGAAGQATGGAAGNFASGGASGHVGGSSEDLESAGSAGQPVAGASSTDAEPRETDAGGKTTILPSDGVGVPDESSCDGQPRNTWIAMSADGAPPPTGSPFLFWTGKELLAYGSAGALYAPCTNLWRSAPAAPINTAGTFGKAIEAKDTLLMFGLLGGELRLNALDYTREVYEQRSVAGAPAASFAALVSNGDTLFLWGGALQRSDPNAGYDGNDAGALYDIVGKAWRATTPTGGPSPRVAPVAWTDHEFATWGGRASGSLQSDRGRMDCAAFVYPECELFDDGALYDPVLDVWRSIATPGAPSARHDHVLAWADRRLLVWGGQGIDPAASEPALRELLDGGLYDPETGAWTPIAPPVPPEEFAGRTPFWTGRRLVVVRNGVMSGWMLDIDDGIWRELPVPDGATGCPAQPAVHAGALVNVCSTTSGRAVILLLPGAAEWTAIPLPDAAPMAPGVLWTGRRLFLWGGVAIGPRGCENPPPDVGCDPLPPVYSNAGWVLEP